MVRKNWLVFLVILIIFAFALWVLFPMDSERLGRKGMQLGLDLVGGVRLVYKADFPEGATAEEKTRNMERALQTIQTRIDKYGVTEPIIQKLGEDRVLVQLPGFTDIDAAEQLVEQTGFLEFRMAELNDEGNPVYLKDYIESESPAFFNKTVAGARLFVDSDGNPVVFVDKDEAGNLSFRDEENNLIDLERVKAIEKEVTEQGANVATLLSWMPARGDSGTELTGSFLDEATPAGNPSALDPREQFWISIAWNEEGGEIFDQIARRIYDSGPYQSPQRSLGIFLDNVLISYPQIENPSYQGSGRITGNFTQEEVMRLANLMESGSLPMPLMKSPLSGEKVAGTLGAKFIDVSYKAGLIGILLVMLFMTIYYRMSGFLASLSLIFYGALVLALFKLIPVTLTLAGLGGFILSIGMAVDANVLIFERMKEEFRAGRTLGAAIEAGFNRAWPAIRDSNVTTFIVCGILYWLGSSIVASPPVMGFALTLFIGVAVSMFTAIVVTRTLLRLFVGTTLGRKTSIFTAYSGRG